MNCETVTVLTEYFDITLEDISDLDLIVTEFNTNGDYTNITVYGENENLNTFKQFINGEIYI